MTGLAGDPIAGQVEDAGAAPVAGLVCDGHRAVPVDGGQ
jgi:hypothetical protein